ncbi:uncharacterized protein LOC110681834 [Chenopodium quinoa]|uniref:uncharacterized protein LOC110681834 n=1 Tax=Chenopodium quinoa TaxID=63459 RepID=UPI000B790A47|nr:uncharacterized protein LOC110681834 [Chenopodium quinoa]
MAQAIPIYAMQCFLIPKSITDVIERMCRNFFWAQKKEERRLLWVAWEKMYFSKKEGGMGVRDFQAFNKALLAKQAWRVLNNTKSLMVKVLKGKYFPSKSFLDVRVSPNASYTWKSIFAARDLVTKGARRVVGDGGCTNIWSDPWVPGLPGFRILPRNMGADYEGPKLVYELIDNGAWKDSEIEVLSSDREAQAIKDIPLPRHNSSDFWTWHFSNNGYFSVRITCLLCGVEE